MKIKTTQKHPCSKKGIFFITARKQSLRGAGCVVAPGGGCGCSQGGGMCGCSQGGGMCGCSWGGACVVAPRRRVWLLWGGVHGCSGGGVHGCSGGMRGFFWGGACIGYDEIRSMSGRYASYWNAFLLKENYHKINVNFHSFRNSSIRNKINGCKFTKDYLD